MQTAIPCLFMRGGTSRGPFFLESDLPTDIAVRDRVLDIRLLDAYHQIAAQGGCTPAQLALAWVLAKGDDILPIPGTKNLAHLEENMAAAAIPLDAATLARLDALINARTVTGPRYNEATQKEIDTETFSVAASCAAPEQRSSA